MSDNEEIKARQEQAKRMTEQELAANPQATKGACWVKAGSSSDCVGVMTKKTCYKVWDAPPYEVIDWDEGGDCP